MSNLFHDLSAGIFPRICIILLLLISLGELKGIELSLSIIPDSLRANSNAIVRKSHRIIDIKDQKTAVIKVQKYVTILNAKGKQHGFFFQVYDETQKIKKIKVELYDSDGKRVRRYRNSDIQDRSLVSGASLFDDTRYKLLEVHQVRYPYSVFIEYEIEYDGFVHFPRWIPQKTEHIGVEESILTIRHPDNYNLRYNEFNLSEPCKETVRSGIVNLEWRVNNLVAYISEPLSPPLHEYLPVVFIAPEQFHFHNTTGNLSTWQDYGDWVANLLEGRQSLPESTIQQVKFLTAELEDNPRKAAKLIYEYMQNHTRYVSIQLGIGGFQPFPAELVANTGYGDCKALTNYTKALLSVAGIDAFYAEIGIENRAIFFEDFPSLDQTNHAILYLPLEGDTIWLECTSQRLPFGYVPRSLQNRSALVVKKGASGLVKIPAKTANENQLIQKIKIDLDGSGNAKTTISTLLYGTEIQTIFPHVWLARQEQLNFLSAKYALPGSIIDDFKIELITKDELHAREDVEITTQNLGSRTGRRMFVNIFPYHDLNAGYQKMQNRKTDFVIDYPFYTSAYYKI